MYKGENVIRTPSALQTAAFRNTALFYFCPECSIPGYAIFSCGGGSRQFEIWSDGYSHTTFKHGEYEVRKFQLCGHYVWFKQLHDMDSWELYHAWFDFYHDAAVGLNSLPAWVKAEFKSRQSRFHTCLQRLGPEPKLRLVEKLFVEILIQPMSDGYYYSLPFTELKHFKFAVDWERALDVLKPQEPEQRLALLLGWWWSLNDKFREAPEKKPPAKWKSCLKQLDACLQLVKTTDNLLNRVEVLRQRGELKAAHQVFETVKHIDIDLQTAEAYRYILLKTLLEQGSTNQAWIVPDRQAGNYEIGFGDPSQAIHDMIWRER